MKIRRMWGSRLALVLTGAVAVGCGGDPGADTGSDSSDDTDSGEVTPPPETESEGEVVGWLEIGWGEGQYVPLSDGDDFPLVRGGQGAEMFPIPLRGAEFYLPGNPTTWMDADGPLIDVEMDIEGFNDGVGGHFKRIANYQLDWVVLEDGTYESSFVPFLMPDGVDSADINGLPAHLTVRVRPLNQATLEAELDVVVFVDEAIDN
ncbi:MAG: hypothetical protein AAF799_04505 [Myxococcota bacterium]